MMRRHPAALCAITLALTAFAAHAADPASFADAKALADRDEASLDATQREAFLQSQSRQLEAAVTNCASPNPDLAPLVIAAQLDARGRIVRTWRQGDTALARCVEQELSGRVIETPPRMPFHISFELSFTR